MFVRSILIPSLVVCAIGAPFLMSKKNMAPSNSPEPSGTPGYSHATTGQFLDVNGNVLVDNRNGTILPSAQLGPRPIQSAYASAASPPATMQRASYPEPSTISRNLSAQTQNALSRDRYQSPGFAGLPVTNSVVDNPAANYQSNSNGSLLPFSLVNGPSLAEPQFNRTPEPFSAAPNMPVSEFAMGQPMPAMMPVISNPYAGLPDAAFAGMTPDYGAAQTMIFPGNAYGPDLTAAPMEFLPITDLNEIFRFDISTDWVKRRWKRVSTNPGDVGLHGLRVALVTGTNSWDLHGSLTYYFDNQQRLQRITFRGWTGDASRLLQIMTSRYQFASQPTHLAGFYTVKQRRKTTGGLLMKNPAVIDAENTVEQVAIVMEVNDPTGSFSLSNEFQSLIAGSTTVNR